MRINYYAYGLSSHVNECDHRPIISELKRQQAALLACLHSYHYNFSR